MKLNNLLKLLYFIAFLNLFTKSYSKSVMISNPSRPNLVSSILDDSPQATEGNNSKLSLKGENVSTVQNLREERITVNYKPPANYEYPVNYNSNDEIPKRHLLVWHENPASEVVVSWGLDHYDPNHEHFVYLSENQQNGIEPDLNYEKKYAAHESGLAESCHNRKHANMMAIIKGLKPNTTYYYIAVSNGQKSREMHFVTAPADKTAFKLLSGGDSRTDRNQRVTMNKMMASMVSDDPSYIGFIHGGDFVSKGSNCDLWFNWRNDHQSSFLDNGRIIPLIPTFGNHEKGGEEQFEKLFGNPLDSRRFYFLSSIANLSLIILNSEISTEGDQKTWLQSTLESLKNKKKHFIVAGYHRPAWPAVKLPAPSTAWTKSFEQYQVNLVLESDGHTLKQTCPIYRNKCDRSYGIIYVGEGGLGVRQRLPWRATRWYFNRKFGAYALSQHHIQSLSISSDVFGNDKLTYEVYYDQSFHHRIDFASKDRSALGKEIL